MPDPAHSPRLFFAFATGNNHANLPILINLARAGDRVCWVVTETAQTRDWAEGAIELLKARGIRCSRLPIDDDIIYNPKKFENEFRRHISEQFSEEIPLDIFFLLVGGQKLNIQAISQFRETQAALENGGSVTFLYQDLKPCVYYSQGSDAEFYERRQFQKPFYLSHLIDSHGWEAKEKTKEINGRFDYIDLVPIWGNGTQRIVDKEPPFTYVFDRPELQQWIYKALKERYRAVNEKPEVPSVAGDILQNRRDRWLGILKRTGVGSGMTDQQVKELLKSAAKLVREATIEALRRGANLLEEATEAERDDLERAGMIRDNRGQQVLAIGDTFEDAVAGRVVRFLDGSLGEPFRKVVSEVYRNVVFLPEPGANPDRQLMEIDVLLVLNNASLIALECKGRPLTGGKNDSERKDSFARILNAYRAAGLGAHFLYCLPLFPPLVDGNPTPTAFLEFHKTFENLADWGVASLCYDDPTRSVPKYEIVVNTGKTEYSYLGFETKLAQILSPFVP